MYFSSSGLIVVVFFFANRQRKKKKNIQNNIKKKEGGTIFFLQACLSKTKKAKNKKQKKKNTGRTKKKKTFVCLIIFFLIIIIYLFIRLQRKNASSFLGGASATIVLLPILAAQGLLAELLLGLLELGVGQTARLSEPSLDDRVGGGTQTLDVILVGLADLGGDVRGHDIAQHAAVDRGAELAEGNQLHDALLAETLALQDDVLDEEKIGGLDDVVDGAEEDGIRHARRD